MGVYKIKKHFIILSLLLTAISTSSYADMVKGSVTYLSESMIYINIGSAQGLEANTTCEVFRKSKMISKVVVVFVAEHSSSCRVDDKSVKIEIGDSVITEVNHFVPPEQVAVQVSRISIAPNQSQKRDFHESINKLSGRISLQSYSVDNHYAPSLNYFQPSMLVIAKMENISGTHHNISVYGRFRQTIKNNKFDGSSNNEWSNRIYEASITYSNRASKWKYGFGRVRSNDLNGVGEFDGGIIQFKTTESFRFGIYGGTRPNLQTSEFQNDETRTGIITSLDISHSTLFKLSSSFALCGEYHKGEISREFMYLQTAVTVNQNFMFYQSGDVNINRGWRHDAGGSTFELTNLFLNCNYSPANVISINMGYDTRKNERNYETRSIADSLFDDRLRQGFQGGIEVRLPYNTSVGAHGGIQRKVGESSSANNNSVSFTYQNILQSGVSLSARFNNFTTPNSRGEQPTIALSKMMFSIIDLSFQAGQDKYILQGDPKSTKNDWIRINANCIVTKWLFLSSYEEINRSLEGNVNRFFVEVGARF